MEKPMPDDLKQQVFDRLERCRLNLLEGTVDMMPVQECVRDYCDALAGLPRDQAAAHVPALQEMMLQLGNLSSVLSAERDQIRAQLDGLGRLRQANVAYQTSDSIGGKPRKESK